MKERKLQDMSGKKIFQINRILYRYFNEESKTFGKFIKVRTTWIFLGFSDFCTWLIWFYMIGVKIVISCDPELNICSPSGNIA